MNDGKGIRLSQNGPHFDTSLDHSKRVTEKEEDKKAASLHAHLALLYPTTHPTPLHQNVKYCSLSVGGDRVQFFLRRTHNAWSG